MKLPRFWLTSTLFSLIPIVTSIKQEVSRIEPEIIHCRGKDHGTAGLQLNKNGFDHKENILFVTVESKLVKVDTICRVVLPPTYGDHFLN